MNIRYCLPLVLCLGLTGFAQTKEQVKPLTPGQPVEREIAGGETHTYQIPLTAGQFMRVLVEQKSVDVVLALNGPDGKQPVERDLTGFIGAREQLSFEAPTAGDYRLVLRTSAPAGRGAYQVLLELKDGATASDRTRLSAEQLLHEARRLLTDREFADPQLLEKLGRSLALWRELNDRYWQGFALNLIGLTYAGRRQNDRAVEPYEQALVLWREEKLRAGEALALRNLGDTYTQITRLDKAVESYEQALPIYRELKDRQGEALALGPLANVYSQLGRTDKAIEYFELALPVNRELKNRYREANNLNGLGNAYLKLGKYEQAIGFYEQALPVVRESKLRGLEGILLGNIGGAYQGLDRHDKAIEYSQQALVVARETKDRSSETYALILLGDAFRDQAKLSPAAQHHEQGLRLARELKNRGREEEALYGLMLDWQARNKPGPAIFYGKQAVNLNQEIRSEITGLERETQQSFVKSKEDSYRTLADLLIAQGRLPEAEQVIRMLKDEEYFEYIRRDSTNAPQGAKAQLTAEEAALEKRYREIADQLAALGSERGTLMDKKSRTPDEEQRLARLDADLVVAGNAFQKFLDQLTSELGGSSDSSGKVFQLRESQGLMEDLRELGKGTVALYTLVGEDKYRVILTTADFQKGYEYPVKAAELNRKVLEFREALQNPRLDPLPLAQDLYKILLGPVAKDLAKAKAQTIMWSLDGVLRYVPVSALNDGQHYLVEQYQNVVFTPASQARLKDAPARNWNALGLGVTKAHGERIPALPGVLDEMRGIIREEAAANRQANGRASRSGETR